MKSFLIAASVAAGVLFGMAPAAEAKTSVQIFFGVPHYTYQIGPDYRFRRGYGWYRPGYRGERRLSCRRAKSWVANYGYRNVSTVECQGSVFTFRGTRRGHRGLIYVNSISGAIWRG